MPSFTRIFLLSQLIIIFSIILLRIMEFPDNYIAMFSSRNNHSVPSQTEYEAMLIDIYVIRRIAARLFIIVTWYCAQWALLEVKADKKLLWVRVLIAARITARNGYAVYKYSPLAEEYSTEDIMLNLPRIVHEIGSLCYSFLLFTGGINLAAYLIWSSLSKTQHRLSYFLLIFSYLMIYLYVPEERVGSTMLLYFIYCERYRVVKAVSTWIARRER